MKHYYNYSRYILLVCLFVFPILSKAQVVQTSYFMNSPYSHQLNPALQPQRGYIGIPVLGNLYVNANTGTTLSKVLYPHNNELVTFFHPDIKQNYDVKKLFHKKITPSFDFNTDIISFGFHARNESFVSFSMSTKVSSVLYIPRGIFEFFDKGSRDEPYDAGFGFSANAYVETALGYSRKIDEKLTVGAKLKYLTGAGNISIKMDGTEITCTEDLLRATLTGEMRFSVPGAMAQDIVADLLADGENPIYDEDNYIAGHGGAIDLGASYKILDNLTVHASVLDLGFIRWNSNYYKTDLSKKEVEFEGENFSNIDSLFSGDRFSNISDDINDELNVTQNEDGKGRTSWLYTKINLGGEYTFFDDRLGVGLLYQSKISSLKWFHELTASVNYRPFKSLSTSLSYSVLQGFNSIGFAVNYRPKYFANIFIGLDYIPLVYTPQFVPIKSKAFSLQFGLTVPLRAKRKAPAKDVEEIG